MWKNYWIKLRRVIAQAKDPEGHCPYLEDFLGESLSARKQRAGIDANWQRFRADEIESAIQCPFDHSMEDASLEVKYVYRLQGTKDVYVCDLCFPYSIRFFWEPDRPDLDKVLRKG
jgi:hypothetical protein